MALFNQNFEIYFLDIGLPNMDGRDLGMEIRRIHRRSTIIYTSVSGDFALESCQVRAFHYLLKLVQQDQLFPILREALRLYEKTPSALSPNFPKRNASSAASASATHS